MEARSERATLKSILFADLAQYSRLTAADELGTLDLVSQCFQLFQTHCEEFGAEFIKTTGDGVLILFDGVSNAIDYAIFMQDSLADLLDRRAFYSRFRIGLHIGEVHRRDGDVFGHDVINAHPLTNEATTSIASADLIRFVEATGHDAAILKVSA